MKFIISLLALLLGLSFASAEQMIGQLGNRDIDWRWRVPNDKPQAILIDDKLNGGTLELGDECFQLVLRDGKTIKSSDFTLLEKPEIEALKADMDSPVVAKHFGGHQLVVRFADAKDHLAADWRVILRDGSTYVRQQLMLRALGGDVWLQKIVLFEQSVPGAKEEGTVDGSPVIAGNFFLGYEHPMAQNTVDAHGVVRCSFRRNAVLKNGESLVQSCVIGVSPAGQMRQGFLAYLERERAHPYRPFLHYNSWFDIAWDTRKYNQNECLDVINRIGRELVEARGVKMDSFLFDDGWDDGQTLWKFNCGFPDGFTPLKNAAAKYGAGIGVWLSPFGGYHHAKEERLKYGSAHGFETNAYGFSLSGPKYFRRFRDICLEMIRKYGVNTFKFDGLAAGAKTGESGLTRDGDAMMQLIADLRAVEPDIYINQTTGTWPSPFWLLYVDSTWRGGDDHAFLGKGSWCQKWMTYRDSQTYYNIVERAPLYPLNSLMLHGIIYATHAVHLDSMSDADFAEQVWEFFASGTQLQELYLTPRLLDQQNWDDLAQAAKWFRANADVLVDTHWVGGDPDKGQVYGWASWTAHKAILALRNPDDKPATFAMDARTVFQLPIGINDVIKLASVWKKAGNVSLVKLQPGTPHVFTLQPFQVLVLEGGPEAVLSHDSKNNAAIAN